jgi:hypothetical protein
MAKLVDLPPRLGVERGGGVELDARPHGRTDRHLLDEGALGAARLGAVIAVTSALTLAAIASSLNEALPTPA